MTILNATEARANLYSLIDEAASTYQPIVITGKNGDAILVSEEEHIVKVLRLWTYYS